MQVSTRKDRADILCVVVVDVAAACKPGLVVLRGKQRQEVGLLKIALHAGMSRVIAERAKNPSMKLARVSLS